MRRLQELRQRLEQARQARETLQARMLELGDREGELEGDEATEFRTGLADFDARGAEIETLETEIAQLERIQQAPTANRDRNPAHSAEQLRMQEAFDRPLWEDPSSLRSRARLILDEVRSEGMTDQHREAVRSLLASDTREGALSKHIIVTGSEAYRTAFLKTVAGDGNLLSDAERQAMMNARAASLTNAAGGYAVPFTLDPTIIDTGTHDGANNPWRRVATVKRTVTNTWRGVTSTGVTASWDGEAVEVSDDTPTLAQPAISANKAQVFVPFSVEIEMDWLAAEGEFRRMFGVAKDDLEDLAFTTGSGSGQPRGLITALAAAGGSTVVAPTTAETFAAADLYSLFSRLPKRYRSRAIWMGDIGTYLAARQFDSAGGSAFWTNLGNGTPDVLMGRPIEEAPAMTSMTDVNTGATQAHNYVLVFGDFSEYYIVDRVGMNVEMIPNLMGANGRPTGQRGIYAWWRAGADVMNANAFRMLDIPTAA